MHKGKLHWKEKYWKIMHSFYFFGIIADNINTVMVFITVMVFKLV